MDVAWNSYKNAMNRVKVLSSENEGRDYTSDMYSINNVTEYFMGKDNALYIIYAYGNENNTNEMDVVIM